MKHSIVLTPEQITWADIVAVDRRANALLNGGRKFKDHTVMISDAPEMERGGCRGELAVSLYFGIEWNCRLFTEEEYKDKELQGNDVGEFEVRETPRPSGCLIIQPDLETKQLDRDDDIFILVLSHNHPEYILAGWIYGREGKQKRFWRSNVRRPAYFVPQYYLKDISLLLKPNLF